MLTSANRTTFLEAVELPPPSSRGRRSAPSDFAGTTLAEALSRAGSGARQRSGSGIASTTPSTAQRQQIATSVTEGQNAATPAPVSGWSIFSGTATPSAPAASKPVVEAPAVTPASMSASPVYATKAEADAAVVQSLKNALSAAGVSFDGLGLEAHEDVVTYPGGSYINRYISVNTHGHVEGLMTDLVGINPKIAVLDIKHMLGMA